MDSDCSYHYTDNFLIDPYEEELKEEKRRRKEMEKMKQHSDMVGFVADGQYGIPRRCPCGGSIKHDVSPSPKFNTISILNQAVGTSPAPNLRYNLYNFRSGFFLGKTTKTRLNYLDDDGLHFRQPWVFGVEQEIEKLVMKVEEQSKTIEEMRKQIQIQAKKIAKLKT
ncbi:unnamed protein product [Thlaspi arvense]|uniref:Uncharacterized protein n=1 Tax=Thlaspi arvense TaxID=13288 RepID=A0AAU9RYB9_THLAR|nr:unnamed protein product [Thlaspi arvense]